MHQVQWHCLPFIVTAQLPLTTSFSKGLLIFLASVQRFGEGRYWPKFLKAPARAPAHQLVLLMFRGWLVKCLTVAFFRWGRPDTIIVKGRCASSSTSCFETPAKGGDLKSMSQLPHSCGPERMGLGWKDGMKPKESHVYEDRIPGEKYGDM